MLIFILHVVFRGNLCFSLHATIFFLPADFLYLIMSTQIFVSAWQWERKQLYSTYLYIHIGIIHSLFHSLTNIWVEITWQEFFKSLGLWSWDTLPEPKYSITIIEIIDFEAILFRVLGFNKTPTFIHCFFIYKH